MKVCNILIVVFSLLISSFHVLAFQKDNSDSSLESKETKNVKKYSEIVTKQTITQKGLLTIHNTGEKFFFEIPKLLLRREILVVTRIAQSASTARLLPGTSKGYAGDEIANIVIRFDPSSSGKIFMRKVLYSNYPGDSSSTTRTLVSRSNVMPIIGVFPIEAYKPDSSAIVVDLTSFMLGDNEPFSFNALQKAYYFLASQDIEKSFMAGVSAYPTNVEITTEKTYVKNLSAIGYSQFGLVKATVPDKATFRLNTSFLLLPEQMMCQRQADIRVGYFSLQQVDFDANPQGVMLRKYIKRWRLEPRPEDLQRYYSGELVEPEKPIVFYIDPATPAKWIPYLMQGVNDWQIAFEKAGFKNAIIAKRAPSFKEDPTWSLYDARHSAIVYKPSEIENASGPSIADPRTGEILESHINWYHNVMELIHDWYFVQCSALDTNARKMVFADSLMGELIRFVASHEVGHALGLTHNMGASSLVPVKNLRDKGWVSEHGFCPSIMDYARFNYAAQPEDKLSQRELMPRIGPYDKWAIEWGYRLFKPFNSSDAEADFMEKWVVKNLIDKNLTFIAEDSWDPRNQREDLGDNAIQASNLGIQNLKRIVPHLVEWTKNSQDGYRGLNRIYTAVKRQLYTYSMHVLNNIGGGMYENLKTPDQPGPVYLPLSGIRQKQSLDFISDHIFNTPTWLLDTAILSRTGQTPLGVIGDLQEQILSKLFFPPYLAGMLSRNSYNGQEKTYTVSQMFEDLRKSVWRELYVRSSSDVYRRNLQKYYIRHLSEAFNMSKPNVGLTLPFSGITYLYASDVTSIIFGHFKKLKADINKALPAIKDESTRDHFGYIAYKIDMVLKEENKDQGY